MVLEVALITVSCVLFIQMGLAEAVWNTLHVESRIASCPKCLTFWLVLLWTITHRVGFIHSVATSFLASYSAVWLAQLYDLLAVMYNRLYDKISKTPDTEDDAQAGDSGSCQEAGCHEVS